MWRSRFRLQIHLKFSNSHETLELTSVVKLCLPLQVVNLEKIPADNQLRMLSTIDYSQNQELCNWVIWLFGK